MQDAVKVAVDALESLAATLGNSWGAQSLREGWNSWNVPPVYRDALAAMTRRLAEKLKSADPTEIPPDLLPVLQRIPRQVQFLSQDTLAHIFNGNAAQAVPTLISTIVAMEATLQPLFDWQRVPDGKMLPQSMARQLRAMQARIANVSPDLEQIDSHIARIRAASEASDALPVDLEELRKAKETVTLTLTRTAEVKGKVDELRMVAEQAARSTLTAKEEADKLVRQSEEAYRITTSIGLAGAFDQRAKRLSTSMWWCVALLVAALGVASYFGAQRAEILSIELGKPQPQSSAIVVHVLLAFFSIAAPVWLAWLATKQIGQRFRLSEDYAFKASVAKAYEGYRREAARIDKNMETRLFASALTRLEEAPLRLVETETHGSPWHELINSQAIQKVLATVPELRDRFFGLMDEARKRGEDAAVKAAERSDSTKAG